MAAPMGVISQQNNQQILNGTENNVPQSNNNGFNIFDNKEISDNFAGNDKNRKLMLSKLVETGSVSTLQLKVLSSAHLEKDFTLHINPMGIVPQ